jgi:hypothetical protein
LWTSLGAQAGIELTNGRLPSVARSRKPTKSIARRLRLLTVRQRRLIFAVVSRKALGQPLLGLPHA